MFESGDPVKRAKAIVQAVDPELVAQLSCGLEEAMVGMILNHGSK